MSRASSGLQFSATMNPLCIPFSGSFQTFIFGPDGLKEVPPVCHGPGVGIFAIYISFVYLPAGDNQWPAGANRYA
jgi:hypothetical protein